MKKIDVIIVLGGGTDGTLNPVFYTKERLTFLISQIKKFVNIPIIMSGGYSSSIDKKPKYTESEVMKHYITRNRFTSKLVYIEDKSRDTIGNAYYSKQIIKKHLRWKNILVVTTTGHILRSRWIFKKIFGKKYIIEYLGVPSHHSSFKKNPGRKKYEDYIIRTYEKMLRPIENGNDRLILKALRSGHPAYSKTKKAIRLKEEIVEMKKTLLGYKKLPGTK
jgi:uncharacterized SAM-binding protein YcdF (DUF218 family)